VAGSRSGVATVFLVKRLLMRAARYQMSRATRLEDRQVSGSVAAGRPFTSVRRADTNPVSVGISPSSATRSATSASSRSSTAALAASSGE
jgi:hypothetical protein